MRLNFADTTFTSTAPASNIISSSSALVFDGESTLNLTGVSTGNNTQTFNGTTLNGFGNVTITAGAAAKGVLLNLGAITRNARGGININAPTVNTTVSATNGVTTSTLNDVNSGILGGWATVGNADWAMNNGTDIVAYAAYTPLTSGGGGTQNATNFTSAGSVQTVATTGNSLKMTGGTLDLATNNVGVTVNGANGGVLTTGTATVATSTTGILGAGSGNELILSGSGTLTISGNGLIGANAGSLTKIGPNTVVISGANSYTSGTTLNSGTLQVQNANALGTGAITFRGGTLTTR